jgi:phosphoribosylformylglycinamidine cyclo-ligase
VHHCIDDILTCGAVPLFFLDYLAFGRLQPERAAAIVGGMAAACAAHGAALVGGETAELPDIYREDAFDVAGFIVGSVAAGHLINGSRIQAGDMLIGLPSTGLHTNGFSLARTLMHERLDDPLPPTVAAQGGATIREALLAEHPCYLKEIEPLLGAGMLLGLAHITGGGLPGNLPRMLPRGLSARLDPGSWTPAPIFGVLQEYGLAAGELYRTFNMGVGMVIACRTDHTADVLGALPSAFIAGAVEEDTGCGRVVGLY